MSTDAGDNRKSVHFDCFIIKQMTAVPKTNTRIPDRYNVAREIGGIFLFTLNIKRYRIECDAFKICSE